MGLRYTQISIEEQCEIARLRATGASVRQIAASLDRAPSTVARELKRNASGTRGYQPRYAEQQARARRWCGSRLERDDGLREGVLSGLKQGWSPEQVAGRLAREAGRSVISHETIYRFIYGQLARKKDYSWRHYLPRAKSKRGWRGRKGGSSASFITLRRPLAERPQAAADRQVPGHWEADLMLFSTYGQAVLALHERYSRLLIAVRPPGKAAAPIATAISSILAPLPPQWRQTLTFDNGTEFPRHHELHALGIETFFCDTHAPWQKGGVENAIGRMRRNLPRKTDLADLTDDRFALLVQAYNNTPRKCLGYNTPAEVFWNHVLHFKCESTLPLSREWRNNIPRCHFQRFQRGNPCGGGLGEPPKKHPWAGGWEQEPVPPSRSHQLTQCLTTQATPSTGGSPPRSGDSKGGFPLRWGPGGTPRKTPLGGRVGTRTSCSLPKSSAYPMPHHPSHAQQGGSPPRSGDSKGGFPLWWGPGGTPRKSPLGGREQGPSCPSDIASAPNASSPQPRLANGASSPIPGDSKGGCPLWRGLWGGTPRKTPLGGWVGTRTPLDPSREWRQAAPPATSAARSAAGRTLATAATAPGRCSSSRYSSAP